MAAVGCLFIFFGWGLNAADPTSRLLAKSKEIQKHRNVMETYKARIIQQLLVQWLSHARFWSKSLPLDSDAWDFIVLLKPHFVVLLKSARISANKGRSGRQVVRGKWHSLQQATVSLSWSGKLPGFLLFSSA